MWISALKSISGTVIIMIGFIHNTGVNLEQRVQRGAWSSAVAHKTSVTKKKKTLCCIWQISYTARSQFHEMRRFVVIRRRPRLFLENQHLKRLSFPIQTTETQTDGIVCVWRLTWDRRLITRPQRVLRDDIVSEVNLLLVQDWCVDKSSNQTFNRWPHPEHSSKSTKARKITGSH